MSNAARANVELLPAQAADFELLVALRIEAMRESLERAGRFDPARARERFRAGFLPEHTRHIVVDSERVGFVAVKPDGAQWLLDHLYIRPQSQGRGIGALVLRTVFAEADALRIPLRVGALKGSGSNRFYLSHGFTPLEEGEFDNYYLRMPCT